MELLLTRTYYPKGTNGVLQINGKTFCYTIELPWKDNAPRISCIPEGVYKLAKRFSDDNQHHLQVQEVPGRSFILIHPANDALRELKGCISPVSLLTGQGCGSNSRAVFYPLLQLVNAAISKGETVLLTIKKQ